MKTLILYYSRTGNTKKVAEEIAAHLHCDIERVIDKKDRSGIIGWMMGGRDGMGEKLTQVEKIKSVLSQYDLIILGTPIWVKLPPAMRTLLHENPKGFKKVAFYCTMGSSGYEKLFEEMKELSHSKPLATVAITDEEINEGTYKDMIGEFVKKISV